MSSQPSPSPSPSPPPPAPPPQHQPSPLFPPPKKTPPLPWSHLETVNLIEVYQEKWYSLKRGQLKASQWEDVAASVAARCGNSQQLSKSATQCRHKMEKLRKRYRSEKQKFSTSVWPYFDLMDLMERGPFPISARPISSSSPVPNSVNSVSHHHWSDGSNPEFRRSPQQLPVASPIYDQRRNINGGPGPGVSRFLRDPMLGKRGRSYEIYDGEVEEDEEEEVEEEEEEGEEEIRGGGGEAALSELASVIRAFGEGFVKIENMKLEMMKETERYRMQMERKRTEMILESQHRIVDVIARALKKANKTSQEI